MDCQRVKYTGHALQRMFQRQVSRADVATVLADGDVIEDYPTEQPLPSCLVYAAVAGRPLHVVVAHDAASKLCLVRRPRARCGRLVAGLAHPEEPMTCVICKHGETAPGHAVVTLQRDECVVVFKGVPAEICANCGEYYLDDAVAEELLTRAEKAIEGGSEVAVQRFAA